LKGRIKAASNIGLLRRSLIVGQFVASIVMIVSTMMISRQLNYLRSKDLGYNKESIVVIPTNKSRLEGNQLAELYKEQLAKETQVKAISTSLYSLNEPGWISMDYKDNNKVRRAFRMNAIDAQFIPALGIQVVAGRAFSPDNPADSANSMIVNETLIKDYGWKPEEAIGKRLPGKFEQTIIGVVKDFNYESLHTPVKPLMLVMKPDSVFKRIDNVMFDAAPQPRITVRLQPGNLESQLAMLKVNWKAIAGDQDFEYRFLDDSLNTMYREEQRLSTIVKYASGLSIFVACMGLFGLATLVVTRRTKEIGIRKVLGADVSNIVGLLSKEFLIMVGIAALVSFPIAWFALHKWLEDFAYRISISWWVFVVAGLVALVIALLTVSFQAIKAAIANPVKSLRTE
jgi:putative ABC transport system permease protein